MSSVQVLDQVGEIVPVGTWNADPHHSQVGFSLKHMKISTIRGAFPEGVPHAHGGKCRRPPRLFDPVVQSRR